MIVRAAATALFAFSLAGCAGSPLASGAVPAPDIGMAGRWILATPNAPTCGMNFAGSPGARAGRVAPEGGCPGRFFTSRRWNLTSGALSILDDDSQPLATLSYANGRYEGQAAGGMPVTLTPPPPPPG